MSKAILVMDMPTKCIGCPLHFVDEPNYWCGANMKDLLTDDIETYKPEWCPLRELPQKKRTIGKESENDQLCFNGGYNACIDEIMKGVEENG